MVLLLLLQEVVERNAFAYNTHCRHCWTGLGKTQLSSRLCCQLCSMALSIVGSIVVPFLLSLVNYFLRPILCYWCSKLLVPRDLGVIYFSCWHIFSQSFIQPWKSLMVRNDVDEYYYSYCSSLP